MLLSVQDRFVQAILEGLKYFSIRAFRKDGRIPKPGEKIFMYHGSRYVKGERKRVFPRGMEPTVSYVGKIKLMPGEVRIDEITTYDDRQIPIGRETIRMFSKFSPHRLFFDVINLNKFAAMDGFNCFADQLAFFKKYHGLPFSGLIIFWKLHPKYLRTRGVS